MMSPRTFRHIAKVRVDLLRDGGGDIDHPRDFRAARVIILFADGAGFESGRYLLRIIMNAPGHPTSRFHTMAQHVMVGIFLVMSPGIVTENGVHLQEAKK